MNIFGLVLFSNVRLKNTDSFLIIQIIFILAVSRRIACISCFGLFLICLMLIISFVEDGEWWIVFVVWLTNERQLALFPAATAVRDPQRRGSLTRCQQDLNLCRTQFQALMNEVVQ